MNNNAYFALLKYDRTDLTQIKNSRNKIYLEFNSISMNC